jgi:hypothetical protein
MSVEDSLLALTAARIRENVTRLTETPYAVIPGKIEEIVGHLAALEALITGPDGVGALLDPLAQAAPEVQENLDDALRGSAHGDDIKAAAGEVVDKMDEFDGQWARVGKTLGDLQRLISVARPNADNLVGAVEQTHAKANEYLAAIGMSGVDGHPPAGTAIAEADS